MNGYAKVGQELRPEHVGTINSSKNVQQVGIKRYICNIVARNMYSIRILLNFSLSYVPGYIRIFLLISQTSHSFFRVVVPCIWF